MRERLLITIDGPAGAGKSTISRLLARKLCCIYLDTGALYRALAWKALQQEIQVTDEQAIADLCDRSMIRLGLAGDRLRVIIDDEDVTENLRTESVGLLASTLSMLPAVRNVLLSIQREVAKTGRVIAEGRDMGTVVFPAADFKFFLEADVDERVRRRHHEHIRRGEQVNYESLKRDLMIRDRQDRERILAPLKVPEDAIVIDSTKRTIPEVVAVMTAVIMKR